MSDANPPAEDLDEDPVDDLWEKRSYASRWSPLLEPEDKEDESH